MRIKISSLFIMVSLLVSTLAAGSEVSSMEKQEVLNSREKSIIEIAAYTAGGEIDRLKPALNEGMDNGLTVNEIKEILVQMYAYAGFPRSLNGLGTFMGVMAERKEKGIKDETGKEPSPAPADKTSLESGTENQTKLVGGPVKGPLFDFAPAIDEYLKAHLFGDIFARDVLTWRDRELATIGALANIKGVNSQLTAHYGISMNNGVTVEQLHAFIDVLKEKVGPGVAANAEDALEQMLGVAK